MPYSGIGHCGFHAISHRCRREAACVLPDAYLTYFSAAFNAPASRAPAKARRSSITGVNFK